MIAATGQAAPPGAHRPRGSAQLSVLADILRRRNVGSIAYFHCDHFEPWRPAPGSQTFAQNADDIVTFAERSAANEFARRLTLFYKAHVPFTRNLSAPNAERASSSDVFGFVDRTPEQTETFRNAMHALRDRVGHDIQVHLHHEHYTSNTGHRDPEVQRIFADPAMAQGDEARLEIALRRSLSAIREETGLPLDRWFFVHGVWALNASDPSVCNITNEIALLMRHGCLGDFTFPAGRPNVDPLQTQPYFVSPVDAPRGYDLAEADPERAWANGAAAEEKFFIWASPIRHLSSSVDYFSPWLREKLAAPERLAEEILSQSVVAGNTLWFKTHSHSMHANYCREGEQTVFPHDFPPLRRLLGMIFDAAVAAGAEIRFATASEVYDDFIGASAQPNERFDLVSPLRKGDKGSASELNGLGERLNLMASAFVRERVEEAGEDAPGIGAYYATRADRDQVLAPYEIRIAELLFRAPAIEIVYEIGSGISVLPMLLAAAGLKAVGIERDQSRAAAARLLLERVAAEFGFGPERCEIWGTAAPNALAKVSGRGAGIVFTNIISTISEEELDRLIDQAAQFDIAIVDLSRFFIVRESTEQQTLLERLKAAGWTHPAPMTGTYWWFRREPAPVDDEYEDERSEAVA